MAEIVLQTTNDDALQSEVAPLILLQPIDNIPEERIDLAKNQGNTVDLEKFWIMVMTTKLVARSSLRL